MTVDKITSPVSPKELIDKTNEIIDNLVAVNIDTTLSTTSTNPVQNKVITSAIPTSTTQLTNDSGFITGITSSMVTSALGFTPYSSANPSGYQANVLETIKVNGTAQTPSSKTVSLSIPSEVTESTVSGWGFTKNVGTVTKVNSILPDETGNVTLPSTFISLTYSELVTLKENSQLQDGAFYRITDYVTTTNGNSANTNEPSKSAGHAFDIIIQALGASNLADKGTCALHSGDTYFANYNLGAWQVWYDISNSTTKYAWADSTNGKGTIYRMIDEFGNDLPYDFKNIQFYRSASNYTSVSSFLTSTDNYYYTFSSVSGTGVVTDYSLDAYTHDNVMKQSIGNSGAPRLNNTIFVHKTTSTVVDTNTFGTDAYNNTFCGNTYGNSVGMMCHDNVTDSGFYYNNIGDTFRNNTISTSFYANEIADYFYGNTVGATFYANRTGTYFYNNTIPLNTFQNTFGSRFFGNTTTATTKGIQQCTFGNLVSNNSFGDTFIRNTLGNNVGSCLFGAGMQQNTLCNNIGVTKFPANAHYIFVGDGVTFVDITISNVYIHAGIQGASQTNLFTTSGLPTAGSYLIEIMKDMNGAVVAMFKDNENEAGYTKPSATSSSWAELLPAYTWET